MINLNKYIADKFSIGTAQFGFDYGIANKRKKPNKKDIFGILEYAYKKGIKVIDTAYAYGDSEATLGEFKKSNNVDLKIITKLPHMDEYSETDIERIFKASLLRLNTENIYGYLVHNFSDFINHPDLWNQLEGLKKKKYTQKIGFSIYRPQELEIIINKNINFDILQVPYSIFDRRFEIYFKALKENKIEIHVRSLFLQGLFFLNDPSLPKNLEGASERIERIRDLASDNNIKVNSLCLNFALLNPYIDRIIIGVDSLDQLKENIEAVNDKEKVKNIYSILDRHRVEDEDILLPYKWRLE